MNLHLGTAINLLDLLSAKRILTDRTIDREDETLCVRSANELRKQITLKLELVPNGPLRDSFQSIRRSAAAFVDLGGRDGVDFSNDPTLFSNSLRDFRSAVARNSRLIIEMFEIDTPDDLRDLLRSY
ncbi:hypothetical protein KZI27_05045 [Curtobacterium sp. TC1]|uniref:hypothetical protein n=1 Tax=Curtobacterium sp. TC1 TaxID=2862880 RepID=UPI001C9AE0A8|nr:hypothetical protein [Curtobacterium sp. TC1]QZQ56213.1 hypothetical protein KZI27_05045 [Curtobacterium sp. TC1]